MQTEVTTMDEALAGLIADNSMSKDCLTAISEEASAEIPFGVMCAQGASDDGTLLLLTSAAAMASALRGISVFGQSFSKPDELGDTGLTPTTTFNVMSKGRIYVQVEEAVAVGDPVRVRAVTGGTNGYGDAGAETAGAFRTSADSTDCVDISGFARWTRGAAEAGFAVVEIDMTNASLALAD